MLTSAQESWALRNLSKRETEAVDPEWVFTGRTTQQPPRNDWHTWLILGGRGSGKTRMGAEWVNGMAHALAPFSDIRSMHIALVGETLADVREVMIDGPSGIMSVSRVERPRFEMTRRRLLWNSGATASMFSSEDPESLRGPQFDAAWCDELAKWKNVQATWDMLQFGLRLGQNPKQVITTTPKPLPLLKKMLADPSIPVRRMKMRNFWRRASSSILTDFTATRALGVKSLMAS